MTGFRVDNYLITLIAHLLALAMCLGGSIATEFKHEPLNLAFAGILGSMLRHFRSTDTPVNVTVAAPAPVQEAPKQ